MLAISIRIVIACVAWCLWLGFSSWPACAEPIVSNKSPDIKQTKKQTRQQLEILRKKIGLLNRQLTLHRQQHSVELYQLNLSEKRLAGLVRKLAINAKQQRRTQGKLVKLRRQRAAARKIFKQQLNSLGEEARLAFLQGHQSYLKILLANSSRAVNRRGFVYHRYIQRYRRKQILAIKQQLKKLLAMKKAISQRTQLLRKLRASFQQQQQQIEINRSKRKLLLSQLAAQLQDESHRLQAWQKSHLELGAVLKVIRTTLSNFPVTKVIFKTFPRLKGNIPWPVKGKLQSYFGQNEKRGSLHSRGVFIRTPVGSQVSAISYGRVAYADWLRGFGLIIVINHGDKYLSLYGHNQTLYKRVGDWVKAGEIIAATGDSGGLGHSGLYFEIRLRGIPLNPVKWCRKDGKTFVKY